MSEIADQGYVNANGYWYPMSDAPADYADLRALVGELAETDPADAEMTHCRYCRGDILSWSLSSSDPEAYEHPDDCLWRRSQRWRRTDS